MCAKMLNSKQKGLTETVQRILRELVFLLKKCSDGSKFLMERTDAYRKDRSSEKNALID
jgi:hypothetical protein